MSLQTAPKEVRQIVSAVCHVYGLTLEKLQRCEKVRREKEARAIAAVLIRYQCKMTYQEIAEALGYKKESHSSVMRSIQLVEQQIDKDPYLQKKFAEVKAILAKEKP